VSEAASPILFPSDAYLQALAGAAAMLPATPPRERDEALCCEFVRVVETLLVRFARGQGALDIAIASRLETIDRRDPLRLGFSSAVDYARERHGVPASTTQKWLRLWRGLRTRPVLLQAVWNGEVSIRKAATIMRAAIGDDEAAWVARAREQTVRALHEAVKGAGREATEDTDERWDVLCTHVPPELRSGLDEAMGLAGEQLGATASRWQRFRAMCQEVLGAHRSSDVDCPPGEARPTVADDAAEAELQAFLEKESAKWAALVDSPPVTAPGPSADPDADLRRVDEELRELMNMRRGWDEWFGRLAFLFRASGGWQRLGFASFAHHCTERLGMQVRAVQQRIALERRLQELPPLREALRTQRVSYEKARLIARHAHGGSVERFLELAERVTCIELKRILERDEDAQMCARREFRVWVPVHEAALVSAAFQAIRMAAGRPLTSGECIGLIAAHFVEVWKRVGARRMTLQQRILRRDRWLCQVPGCSKAAAHVHHIIPRSAGGTDDEKNLISLCAAHHLHGVHMGWVRVWRVGEDRLRWQLGVRPGFPPIVDVTVVAPWAAGREDDARAA
jgi:hypothetical protein